jgi:hypothetical protein
VETPAIEDPNQEQENEGTEASSTSETDSEE